MFATSPLMVHSFRDQTERQTRNMAGVTFVRFYCVKCGKYKTTSGRKKNVNRKWVCADCVKDGKK